MSLRPSAARYAKALFDVALAESDPARVETDLATIVEAMNAHTDLRHALLHRSVAPAARINVVRALTAQAGLQPPVARLLAMLASRGRLELLPDLLDVYRERLRAHKNIVRATVSAATPLPQEKVQALEQSLRGLTGKQVELDLVVDPSLIGGVVAKIGSTVYDGSIRTQLQKLKQQLVENS
jgi:F-type H+-transporting ATPase subunit delta